MVKIASLKGFLFLMFWQMLIEELKNWLKRYWIKKTINRFMVIFMPISYSIKDMAEIEKQNIASIHEQLCKDIKTRENSAYFGI